MDESVGPGRIQQRSLCRLRIRGLFFIKNLAPENGGAVYKGVEVVMGNVSGWVSIVDTATLGPENLSRGRSF